MLLTKKNKFSIEEGRIRKDVQSPEGGCLVKINLRYPDIRCGKKDPMALYARDFYANAALAFSQYAESELASAAAIKKAAEPESFVPFSAVMKYDITFTDERFISVMLDISVSDGREISTERKTQVWEREHGTKCKAASFISKKETDAFIKEKLPEEDKKRFDRELFVLRESGMEFFIRRNRDYRSAIIPFLQKNPIKVTE